FEPLGRLGLRLHLSDCASVVGIGIGVGSVCVGRTSMGPADTEIVRDLDAALALVAGGCRAADSIGIFKNPSVLCASPVWLRLAGVDISMLCKRMQVRLKSSNHNIRSITMLCTPTNKSRLL
ncbi:hypothetical protein X777_15635, partial [Ooceraea biroi]